MRDVFAACSGYRQGESTPLESSHHLPSSLTSAQPLPSLTVLSPRTAKSFPIAATEIVPFSPQFRPRGRADRRAVGTP